MDETFAPRFAPTFSPTLAAAQARIDELDWTALDVAVVAGRVGATAYGGWALIDDVATSGYNARHENRRRP
jgi:hypothetical protein